MDESDILTIKEVCLWLRVNRNIVYDAVRRKELKALRIGRSIRILRADVLDWARND